MSAVAEYRTIDATRTVPPQPGTPDAAAYWHRRAVWAEHALCVIEREVFGVERRLVGYRRGLDVLWRLRARYPMLFGLVEQHRDREQDRRIARRTRPRRPRG